MSIFSNFQFSSNPNQDQGILGLLQQMQAQPNGGMMPQPAQQPAPGSWPESPTSNYMMGNSQVPLYGNAPEQPQISSANRQPQPAAMPVPQAPQMQQAPDSGFADKMRAGFDGFVENAHTGPLGAILGGISRATGGQNSTEKALIAKGLDPVLAKAARENPAIMQAILPDLFNKNSFKFTVLPDGTMVRENPRDGTVSPVYQAGQKPTFGVIGKDADGKEKYGFIDTGRGQVKPIEPFSTPDNFVTGPDGKQIPIPPGVDRKAFVSEISRANAKVQAGERTEVQAKSEKFGNKMELAEKNMPNLQNEGMGQWNRAMESVPLGNFATGENYQKYRQARDNFITALLRDESGAAIGTSEFNRYEKELFPQPGDTRDVVQQKADARRVAIEAMKKSAGPGYKSPAMPEQSNVADELKKKYGLK